MKIYTILFSCCIVILFPYLAYSQYSSPEFEHLSIGQGLYQSSVNCMLQDHRGLLWFGTNDGLSMYDGYSFKTYRNKPSDRAAISENNITAIGEDDEGNLWIGTLSGFINIYNPSGNIFTKYKLEFFPLFSPPKNYIENIPPCYAGFSYNTVTAIYCDKNEFIWIGTFGSGLFRFDPYENSLIQYYYSDAVNTISSDYILSIAEDNKGSLWIATFTGGLNKIVLKIDPQTRKEKELKFSAYLPDKNSAHSISDARITSLEFSGGKLWIGTFGGGLNILNTNQNDSEFSCIKAGSGKNSLSGSLITKIDSDEKGNLWIGTFGSGLTKLDIESNSFTAFRNTPRDQNSLDNNEVVSLLADKTGIIWAGTFSGYGINKLNPYMKKFDCYKSDPAKNSLIDHFITAFAEDSGGNIWIGTYKGGLNKFNRKEKSFTPYRYEENKGINSSYITCLLADNKNRIWIGTYDSGLNILYPREKKFFHYMFDKKNKLSISSSRISSIVQDKNGIIWIGTFNKGLNKVSEEKDGLKFTVYRNSTLYPGTLPSDNISNLFKDKNGNLWAVSGGRFLSELNYETEEFSSYPAERTASFSGFEILSVCCDSRENIWIGTGKGLLRFNGKSKTFINTENPYIMEDKSIYGILYNENNHLWLGTNYGIIRYGLTDQSTAAYNLNNGLQSLKYTSACLRAKSGEMFFGGISGFNCFFPDSIQNEKKAAGIIITSLLISGREILLPENNISLSSSDNSFLIYFTSTDYRDPSKNEYLFMLEGHDAEWKYASGNIHNAEYKKISSGSYLFKVKESGSDKITRLHIIIPVVFWKSWWFILLSFLIIGGLASYFVYYRIRQYLLIEKLKTRLSADLHDNVGSGLTEISLLCEIVQRDYRNELKKSSPGLDLIARRSRELIDNMSDIVWLVNPKSNTLYNLILRLKDIYDPVMNSLGINFKVVIPDEIINLNLEIEKRQNIYLIFKEGINNSIKYSNAKDILLNVEFTEDLIKIVLKDNGSGFDINSGKGNGLVNMKRRAENIGAHLSIQTSRGKGTTIVLEWKQ